MSLKSNRIKDHRGGSGEDIPGLGKKGNVVKVKHRSARYFHLPPPISVPLVPSGPLTYHEQGQEEATDLLQLRWAQG